MEAASVLTLCRLAEYDAGSQATSATFLYSELLLNRWLGLATIYTAKEKHCLNAALKVLKKKKKTASHTMIKTNHWNHLYHNTVKSLSLINQSVD